MASFNPLTGELRLETPDELRTALRFALAAIRASTPTGVREQAAPTGASAKEVVPTQDPVGLPGN